MAPKKKKEIPALEDFPRPLRMAVARVMAKYNLDYPEALERARARANRIIEYHAGENVM